MYYNIICTIKNVFGLWFGLEFLLNNDNFIFVFGFGEVELF